MIIWQSKNKVWTLEAYGQHFSLTVKKYKQLESDNPYISPTGVVYPKFETVPDYIDRDVTKAMNAYLAAPYKEPQDKAWVL